MSTKTVANSEPFTSKIINSLAVRTLTGLDLEQAIIENAQRRPPSSPKFPSIKKDPIGIMPTYWTIYEIKGLIEGFQTCKLPRYQWTHHAHLIVALWYLTHYSKLEATNFIRNGIKNYNCSIGIKTTRQSDYHETITFFWIQIVHQYLCAEGEKCSLEELANGIIQDYGNARLPFEYYSSDLLMSQEARQSWIEPNLKPLQLILKQ